MPLASIFSHPLHTNLLLLLGIAIFGGTVGARFFKRIRLPQVVGYIVIGLILGESGVRLFSNDIITALRPFNFFALGIIGFMIGGELRAEVFKKYGRQFFIILLCEALGAFFLVGVLTALVTYFATGNPRQALALGMVLGAVSSATAPAATVDVLWEYRAGGPLTATVLAVVALDDGLSLTLYGMATSIADSLLGKGSGASWHLLVQPLYGIFGAAVLGGVMGIVLNFILRKMKDRDNSLTFTIGALIALIGLTRVLDVDLILSAMCFGLTVANLAPRRSRAAFELVERFAPPIYVLFFVLVGARLKVAHMALWVWGLTAAYVMGRTGGKMLGARLGARWGGAPDAVRRYLGLCLFSQAGVAIGLSILASQRFTGASAFIGQAVIMVVTASTFVVQLIGPPMVKLAATKAGETGMNITEEDLIAAYHVEDVMERQPVTIPEDTPLSLVLKTFGEHDFLCYPVVDTGGALVGSISFQQVKDTLASSDLNALLVAHDLMEEATETTSPEAPLQETLDRMRHLGLEHMAVVSSRKDARLVGFLDRQIIMRTLAGEIIRRKEKMAGTA